MIDILKKDNEDLRNLLNKTLSKLDKLENFDNLKMNQVNCNIALKPQQTSFRNVNAKSFQ